jgi:alpha-ketoglutarate-dependent taurine dioxygenase
VYFISPVVQSSFSVTNLNILFFFFRFNPYDRAPLNTVPAEEVGQFYDSYAALSAIVQDSKNEFWLKLEPGMVLLVDNWRVMHGRSAFTGKRVLCGCYLPRDDWTNKARVLGLL